MILTYTVTEEDYLAFNLFHNRHSKTMQSQKRRIQILLPIIALLLSIAVPSFRNVSGVILVIIAIVLSIFVFPKLLDSQIKKNLQHMIREGKSLYFIGNHTLYAEESVLRSVSPRQTVEEPYTNIESIVEDDQRLYLYNSSLSAHIIPFSAFASQEERERFVLFIEERASTSP